MKRCDLDRLYGATYIQGMSTTATQTTSMGYKVYAAHPTAERGGKYRFTTVSGIVHVDEYCAPFGVWVYIGTLPG